MMLLHSLRVLQLVFLLCILTLLQPCSAGTADSAQRFASTQELVSAVTREAALVHSLSCAVFQEKHLAMLARPVIFTGRMSVQRPDRLRWAFISPIPSVFIINGSRVIRCTLSSKPVEFDLNSSPAMKQAAAQMLAWVSGDFQSLAGMFSMALARNGTGLVLVPGDKTSSAGITKITVMFDPKTLRPVIVRMDEQGGDWTRIILSDYRIDPVFPKGEFSECTSDLN